MHIDALDHFVLTVRDTEATVAFYERALGMTARTFAGGRIALHFGTQKINLHACEREFEPKAAQPTPGSADLCFLTHTPVDAVIDHMTRLGISIVEGPVERTGATERLRSIYVRDPDGNLIEVANREA